jgi:hypothetical protein
LSIAVISTYIIAAIKADHIMKKLQHLFYKLPEFYLIIFILLAGYKPLFYIAPFAIIGVALVLLQCITRDRISGLIHTGLLIVGSLLFLFAVISEFRDFPVLNAEAYRLLVVGSTVFLVNLIMAFMMFKKYFFGLKA